VAGAVMRAFNSAIDTAAGGIDTSKLEGIVSDDLLKDYNERR
jgi:hypothetical protein